MVKLIFLSSR